MFNLKSPKSPEISGDLQSQIETLSRPIILEESRLFQPLQLLARPVFLLKTELEQFRFQISLVNIHQRLQGT